MDYLFSLVRSIFSVPDVNSLPRRVQTAIEEQVYRNEILVRVVQLVLLVFFAVIYFITPKTYPKHEFATVPWVLGTYAVLGIIGLCWSMRQKLPHWAIYLSILFDFTLLYGLIVSFHLQYDQPSSFILKSPTLFYVFIFIALNALRFEPKFVITAGLTAASGWMLLVVYVVRHDPGDSMITNSYVEYLTSNSVLVGAEIDKVISMLSVTGILTLAVMASSKLLIAAVNEGEAAREFSRFFDDSVARNIRTNDGSLDAGEARKVEAAILNVDLRNFTRMVREAEPDQIMKVLTAYQARVLPLIKANGGVIDKFMGDGIMASFGVEAGEGNPACQLVKACEDILQDWQLWNEEGAELLAGREIGLGGALGTVAYGAVGPRHRLEFTVIGAAVNLSARLEKLNRQLGSNCIVSAPLWREALSAGYEGNLQARNMSVQVHGMEEKVPVAVLSVPELLLQAVKEDIADISPVVIKQP